MEILLATVFFLNINKISPLFSGCNRMSYHCICLGEYINDTKLESFIDSGC